MTEISLADGEPYVGDFVAAVDESSPPAGPGIYYVVTTAVILEPTAAADIVRAVVGERERPFHWRSEGPQARTRMIDVVTKTDLLSISNWRSVAPRRQSAARSDLLAHLSRQAASDGVTHLIIESGDRSTNRRDQATLLDTFRDTGGAPFHYDWRSKAEPLLWVADAISGAVADYLIGRSSDHYQQLIDAGLLEVDSK